MNQQWYDIPWVITTIWIAGGIIVSIVVRLFDDDFDDSFLRFVVGVFWPLVIVLFVLYCLDYVAAFALCCLDCMIDWIVGKIQNLNKMRRSK